MCWKFDNTPLFTPFLRVLGDRGTELGPFSLREERGWGGGGGGGTGGGEEGVVPHCSNQTCDQTKF